MVVSCTNFRGLETAYIGAETAVPVVASNSAVIEAIESIVEATDTAR
jgi:maleate cis-trans isomerase